MTATVPATNGATMLDELSSRALLEPLGIAFNPVLLLRDVGELDQLSARLRWPLVLKIVSQQIVHKSDIGGVITGITSLADAREAFQTILSRAAKHVPISAIQGVSVQPMVTGVAEVLLGARRTDSFGAVIMLGAGGVLVELLHDVSLRICPVTPDDIRAMIDELALGPLLHGYRGRPAADVNALVELAGQLSRVMMAHDEILEVDLNPVLVGTAGFGCIAVDARVAVAGRDHPRSAP